MTGVFLYLDTTRYFSRQVLYRGTVRYCVPYLDNLVAHIAILCAVLVQVYRLHLDRREARYCKKMTDDR